MVTKSVGVDREEIIARLRAHEAELKAAGIVRLHLHGSVARDEAGPESDIDLAGQFDKRKRLPLLDMVGLKNRLSDTIPRFMSAAEYRWRRAPAGRLPTEY